MVDLLAAAVLIGLAAHRVWRVVARDSITARPRLWIIHRTDIPAVRWLWTLVDCPWCLGWWLTCAGAVTAAVVYDWTPLECVAVWFAASTVTGVVGRGD